MIFSGYIFIVIFETRLGRYVQYVIFIYSWPVRQVWMSLAENI